MVRQRHSLHAINFAHLSKTLSLSLSLVKGVKRLALGTPLLIGLASFVNAESSGAFVGIEAGEATFGRFNLEYSATDSQEAARNTKSTTKGNGFGYGIIAGYKYFFTPQIGIRAYANFNHTRGEVDVSNDTGRTSTNFANLFNYGVNVDFLGNFLSTENMDIGGFLGIGLGAKSLTGPDIKNQRNAIKEAANTAKLNGANVDVSTPAATFDVALNVGLRANLAKHHGVEAVARVPFLPATIADLSIKDPTSGASESLNYSVRSTWSLNVRYTYSF